MPHASREFRSAPTPSSTGAETGPTRNGVLYPVEYTWFIFLAALDIMLTWIILHDERGREENILAAWVIERYDLTGIVLYKFMLVTLVIGVCEFIGRRRRGAAQRLARWSVLVTAFPVVLASILILQRTILEFSTLEALW